MILSEILINISMYRFTKAIRALAIENGCSYFTADRRLFEHRNGSTVVQTIEYTCNMGDYDIVKGKTVQEAIDNMMDLVYGVEI